jgi:hypothetical protein
MVQARTNFSPKRTAKLTIASFASGVASTPYYSIILLMTLMLASIQLFYQFNPTHSAYLAKVEVFKFIF